MTFPPHQLRGLHFQFPQEKQKR